MVQLSNLVFLPFIVLLTSPKSNNIYNNQQLNNVNNVSENITYSSVEEVKALMISSEVNVKGVVTSKVFDTVYIADQFSGIGIEVRGLSDINTIELKSIIGVSGVLHIDSNSHVKYIKDAINNGKLVANNDVIPIELINPNEYLIPEHVGDIVMLPSIRYEKLNKVNDYKFSYDMGNKSIDLSIRNDSYLKEEANFLNAIGKLKQDNSDLPLIQDKYYTIETKKVTAIVNVNNNKIQYDLIETSNLDFDYKKIIELVTLNGINNDMQCVKQYDIAKTFILNMPKDIIDNFKISNEYHLKLCRERYLAWAKYHDDDPWMMTTNIEKTMYLNDNNYQYLIVLGLLTTPMLTVIVFIIYKSYLRRNIKH